MSCVVFFHHYTSVDTTPRRCKRPRHPTPPVYPHLAEMEQIIQVLCDEEAISAQPEAANHSAMDCIKRPLRMDGTEPQPHRASPPVPHILYP